MVVYWNVAGIAASNIDGFLNDMENEVLWDVLILVEFSAARNELHLSGIRTSGHLVCAQPYSLGKRAGAIVFHCRLRIHRAELLSHGRAFGADFSWGGWRIRVVGGHADAGGDRRPYQQSIDDMEYIIESTPNNRIVILGADIQDPLGPRKAFDDPLILGEYVMGNRGWKGERFLRLMTAYNMHLPHTYVEDFDLAYTCMNNGRSEPKQMDYMATNAPCKWITRARRAESDATVSDHWPLVLNLLRRRPEEVRGTREQKKSKNTIGWAMVELTYNDNIRERSGLEVPLDVAEVNLNAHHIYTDGSFTGFRNATRGRASRNKREDPKKRIHKAPTAGWAAAFFEKGHPPNGDTMDLPEWNGGNGQFSGILRGRVITNRERDTQQKKDFCRRGSSVQQHGGDAGGDRDAAVSAGAGRNGRVKVRGGRRGCHPL